MTRPGTVAAVVFISQKMRHLFLTFKGIRLVARLVAATASISGFQFAKQSVTVLFGAGGEIDADRKFGSEGPIEPDRRRNLKKKLRGNFPLKSKPYDFDGLGVGFLRPSQEKTNWNRAIGEFRNKDPGKRRKDQYKSPWDVLHPGRKVMAKLADSGMT